MTDINTRSTIEIKERERRVISWISRMNEMELYGVECFIAGARAGMLAQESSPAHENTIS